MKICLVTANLGGIDPLRKIEKQKLPEGWELDIKRYSDNNVVSRKVSMSPRMQAKIYRTHMHQLHPGYDLYIWLDGSFSVETDSFVQWVAEELGKNDAVFFKHYDGRNSIKEEMDFVNSFDFGINTYLRDRYQGEPITSQVARYLADKKFSDDYLIASGCFAYRPLKRTEMAMEAWYYEIARWSALDQLSLPYVLQKNKVKIGFFSENMMKTAHIKHHQHAQAPVSATDARGVVDVVMLAYTTTEAHQNMTQEAIRSLHASETNTRFNVVVMESYKPSMVALDNHNWRNNKDYTALVNSSNMFMVNGHYYMAPGKSVGKTIQVTETKKEVVGNNGREIVVHMKRETPVMGYTPKEYTGCTTVRPDQPFNYNTYMNLGCQYGTAEHVLFCNNDLIFHKDWWSKMKASMIANKLDSASPKCPVWYIHQEMNEPLYLGYRSSHELSGWAIMSKRSTLAKIGGFDERFGFYGADCSYGCQLKRAGLRHGLVTDSVVTHLLSKSTKNEGRPGLYKASAEKMKELYPEWPLAAGL